MIAAFAATLDCNHEPLFPQPDCAAGGRTGKVIREESYTDLGSAVGSTRVRKASCMDITQTINNPPSEIG